jgi:glutamyl-tRNA synthetase
MNGQWIRRIFDEQGAEALYARTQGFWPEIAKDAGDEYRLKVLSIIYDRLKTLSDLREMTAYFFADPEINLDLIINNKFLKKISEAEIESMLKTTISKLTQLKKWDAETLQSTLNDLLQETGKKPAEFFSLIRIALSFAPFSPALNLTMEVLGREKSLARLNAVARAI